jgi:ubiquinone/menaquinone biosynthesis C-methylase UbiE
MFRWFRRSTLDPLSVSMTGAKLGDRFLCVGCSDPQMIAALATKSGLTGRACAIDSDADRVQQAERIALAEGALIEASVAPLDGVPFDSESFDLVVLRELANGRPVHEQAAIAREAHRVLRPGGRSMIIDSMPRAGMFASKSTAEASPEAVALAELLKAQGFVAVRVLAERDGLRFVEGVKKSA